MLVAVAALCLLVGATGLPQSAYAHGQPAEFAAWGGYPEDAASCQRVISRAVSQCIGRVSALRANCLSGAVRGGTCDETALTAEVTATRQRAIERVQRSCTVTELQNLNYIDLSDALTDVVNACRQLDTAAMSAAFGPVTVGGTVGSAEDPTAACVEAGARATTRLLRFGMRTYAKALDRIAALNLSLAEKQRLIAWAERRIALTRARSRAALIASCNEGDFGFAYGRGSIPSSTPSSSRPPACSSSSTYRTPCAARRRCAATACRSPANSATTATASTATAAAATAPRPPARPTTAPSI